MRVLPVRTVPGIGKVKSHTCVGAVVVGRCCCVRVCVSVRVCISCSSQVMEKILNELGVTKCGELWAAKTAHLLQQVSMPRMPGLAHVSVTGVHRRHSTVAAACFTRTLLSGG